MAGRWLRHVMQPGLEGLFLGRVFAVSRSAQTSAPPLCLGRFTLDEAHLHMRVGIIRLNAAHGTEETAVRGYHDTLTRVWFLLVAALRQEDDAVSSEDFPTKHAARLDRNALLRYYSKERLFSTTARAVFVPPDLERLPGDTSTATF